VPEWAIVGAYRFAYRAARVLPGFVVAALAWLAARAAVFVAPARVLTLTRNLSRAHGRELSSAEARRGAAAGFGYYGRYWAESFRLPGTPVAAIDAGIDVYGFGPLAAALERARAGAPGPILALPHLGGWEWAAYWLTQVVGVRVTVVAEDIQPPALAEFMLGFRESLGMEVILLGPGAAEGVVAALSRGDIVCLLCDRDIDGTGVDVEFFGERTTLPPGPALLSLRTGAPLFPVAVYFNGTRHRAVVRPAMDTRRHGRLRADVARVTQELAGELEALITAAPEQWHLLQPNWPSDHAALAAAGFAPPPAEPAPPGGGDG